MGFFTSRRAPSNAATLRKSNEQPLAGVHHQERESNHFPTKRTARRRAAGGVLAFLLFLAAGLSIAALVADSWHKYWFYVNESGVILRTGYFQWQISTDGLRHSLKELTRGVYIMGIISLCYTGVSALTAIICFFATFSRRTSGKGLFLWAQLFSITFAGVLIAFFIVTAIYEAKYLILQTRALSICHPDWAWCLAMGAALCWWLTSLVAAGLPSSRRRPESLPIVANGVFGARDVDTIAPLNSPKAASSDGAWTRADPAAGVPPQKKRRGLFSKRSSGASVPNGTMSSAQPEATLPSAPVAEPTPIGARYSQWIQNSQPNRVPTRV